MSDFDPRPQVKKDFYSLLQTFKQQRDFEVYTEKPYKISVVVRTDDSAEMSAETLALGVHPLVHTMIGDFKFRLKTIEIGQSYVKFRIEPDWAHYMEKRVKQHSDHLEMDDIIPI